MNIVSRLKALDEALTRSRLLVAGGIVVLGLASVGLLYLSLSGVLRKTVVKKPTHTVTSSTVELIARRLDGVSVPKGEEALPVMAVMVENYPDARPLSGLSKASVVIESPVEGGITRFIALFDATSTVNEIGPVRSARPYFVEWARGWRAMYAHVGGSPEAISLLNTFSNFINVDEMRQGRAFWRSSDRSAPHNAYTSTDLLRTAMNESGVTSSSAPVAWHFDQSTSTETGDQKTLRVPYGGTYNVTWKFDKDSRTYTRSQAGVMEQDKDGETVQAENVVVMKTQASVLDTVGRLRIRTTGGGEAVVYRMGKKYIGRWSRGINEPIRFVSASGSDILLTPGRTWIEVTTDDKTFAGLEK